MTTAELLSETVLEAQQREEAMFEALSAEVGGKIVLYGAGRLGRKALVALRGRCIEPLAFADNDAQLVGSKIEGVRVLSPAEAASLWRNDALFVITIFLPSEGGIRTRLLELRALNCRLVTTFVPLGWAYNGILPHFGADLPSRLLKNAEALASVNTHWFDNESREIFRRQLEWRLRAVFEDTQSPSPDQYFPRDLIRPNPEEFFVDAGAFDGDTLRSAPWNFDQVLAIEPDPTNAAKIRQCGNPRLRLHGVLLGRSRGSAHFEGLGTMASSRSNTGTLEVAVETLDDLAAGKRPTFIKLDVEGDELQALEGGRQTLKRTQPIVAVCIYHRPEDLWTIPLFLQEILPSHRKYLRVHAWDGFELVAYAVPPQRCMQTQ
jgi:FkbM family methyltransferase